MNATPMNINPANAVQAQSTAGKQQDATTPDVPFSQVLSSEIAQNRKSSGNKQDTDAQAGADAASQADHPAATGADVTAQTTSDKMSTIDPLALAVTDALTAPQTPRALSVTDALTTPETPLALPVTGALTMPETPLALPINPDPVKLEPARAGSVEAEQAPDLSANTLLALPISPDPLQPRVPQAEGVDAEQSSELAANTLPFESARKGRTPLGAQADKAVDPARSTGKTDPALPLQASATAAAASAFTAQLAAARQSDAMKTGEFVSDLMSNPAMRPASHAQLETLHAPNDVASPRLAPTVGTPAWGQAVGEKIVWMATAAQQTATLTLNPPDMGPLQIVLNVSNEQATASFFSAQPEVRQALEAAFPKLREMMNEAGIQLGQATVSADTRQQNDASDRQPPRVAGPFPGADEAVTAGLSTIHAPVQQSGRGLIDTFA